MKTDEKPVPLPLSPEAIRLNWILKEMANRAGVVNRMIASSSSGYAKSDPEVAFFKAFDALAHRPR